MSAKVAEQQMKEIQSESQRMARELPITYVTFEEIRQIIWNPSLISVCV